MAKGVLYIMTTSVSGVIKIGIANTKNYPERMRHLSQNGYANVSGLKPYFAIEIENYEETEGLLKDLFTFIRLGSSELYSMEPDKAKQLLLAFSGNVIFPKDGTPKTVQIKQIAATRKKGQLFNMYEHGIKKGDILTFVDDHSIKVKVVGEREVEYNGVIYKLSPLALKFYEDMGKANPSKRYQGANYFLYKGTRLTKL
jgi:hypothetical protein